MFFLFHINIEIKLSLPESLTVPEENVIFAVIERQVQAADNTKPPVYGKSRDFNIFG